MSHISRSVISSFGIQHYKVDYDIILMFGMTELKAQLCWKENVSYSTYIQISCHITHGQKIGY